MNSEKEESTKVEVAANNINGETIESALPVMNRNRSGVVVQAPDLKANTNFKYEKLKLIGIDEVR